ncbi:MAG: YigZ family protein [Treponema sp.]|nr:YigZ family protein [Spirochaetia bacterium]MDD7533343.1 YigZ family protein [Treponema sp.]MDY5758566.1 YigZ family protein [Treponema sp.]
MEILKSYISYEETIKGSRFLSELFPCDSQAGARELVKNQKAKYADATHVVHAFVIGPGAEVMGMSDDGEPSGTAGRPALDVLRGRACTNTVLTITRWFGGTLLGTGGLVKAYGNGAKGVLAAADEAGLFEELVVKKDFTFTTDYSLYKLIKNNMEAFHISGLTEDFGTEITIQGEIHESEYQVFISKLLDISNGRILVK